MTIEKHGEDMSFTFDHDLEMLSGAAVIETHHIIWLAQGGSDSTDNVVALCPNCHRKMHIVNDNRDVEMLQKLVITGK